MIGDIIRHLDFLRHCIAPGNRRVASAQRRVIHALAFRLVPAVEAIAGEPVVAIAGLSGGAVGVVAADGAVHVCAGQNPGFETVFGGLLLGVGGDVPGDYERGCEGGVFADPVAEHATVVAIVVDAPLDGDDLPGGIGCDGCEAPVAGGVVVVDAHASVVAAGAGA
jgi:hypothetical protein